MREKLITKEEIQANFPALQNRPGGTLVGWAMRLFGLHKANHLYDACKKDEGADFCRNVLDYAGVNLVVENPEVLDAFREQNFVTISNHPYGHLDALALIEVIARVRPDYKIMANFILKHIDTIAMHLVAANPYKEEGQIDASAFDSIRETMEHIRQRHPYGFFPAGKVSVPKFKKGRFVVEDTEWKPANAGMVKRAGVPVIPVWFSGCNSWKYNLLGLFGGVRTVQLIHEIGNKQGKTVRMCFGQPILPQELEPFKDKKELAAFLKRRVYELEEKKKPVRSGREQSETIDICYEDLEEKRIQAL